MADLMIVAAGNGTRMGSVSIPKLLYPILKTCNLDRISKYCHNYVDKIFVVIRSQDKDIYINHLQYSIYKSIVHLIPIESGKGDGHAILTALDYMETNSITYDNDLVIMWGDCVLTSGEIISELITKSSTSPFIFPVKKELEPYVWFKPNFGELSYCTSANFSKRGEATDEGYHDQSIFKIKANIIHGMLSTMHDVLYRNDNYITNNELNFLHLIHFLHNSGTYAKMYETDFKTYSFNTIIEAQNIELILK
jgi:bifunctional N-acetylglucosamine-1-phosphate-uridyltransferase/glucosamine-1-phosphate-acetyltransferase GlmU-like protein